VVVFYRVVPVEPKQRDVAKIKTQASTLPLFSVGSRTTIWGTPKITVGDEGWEEFIHNAILKATMIVLLPLDTPSTIKEISWALNDREDETLFIMLPSFMTRYIWGYKRRWGKMRTNVGEKYQFPPYVESGMLFMMSITTDITSDGPKWVMSARREYSNELMAHLFAQSSGTLREKLMIRNTHGQRSFISGEATDADDDMDGGSGIGVFSILCGVGVAGALMLGFSMICG